MGRRGLHSNTIDQSYATSEETGLSFEEYLEIANTDQNAHAGPVKRATGRSAARPISQSGIHRRGYHNTQHQASAWRAPRPGSASQTIKRSRTVPRLITK